MDERGANIDLLFRNGLKDYEVLPPPDVWDSIQPSIKIKSHSFPILRAAAVVIVILTVSFLAYRWSSEIVTQPDRNTMAMNVQVFRPLFSPVSDKSIGLSKMENLTPVSSEKTVSEATADELINNGYALTFSPSVKSLYESNTSSSGGINLIKNQSLTANNSFRNNSFEIAVTDQQYFPDVAAAKPSERWSIAAMASPTYYSNFNSGNSELANQLASSEQPLMSYSGGVSVSYKLNKRLSIQTGLYYSALGQELDGVSSFAGFKKYDVTKGDHNFEVLTSSGPVYTTNPDIFLLSTGPGEKILTAYTNDVFDPKKSNLEYLSSTLEQNFSYLELPVVLRYKMIDKTVDFNLIGGLSYNFLLSNSVSATVGDQKYQVGTTEGLNPYTISSSLGMGMEYNLSKKFSINLEPTFRYYLNPFNSADGSNNHPYSFGLFSGLSYKF